MNILCLCVKDVCKMYEMKMRQEYFVQRTTDCTRYTVFPRFSAPRRLPIFEVFGGALNRAGALIRTYENLDLPFPAHTRAFINSIKSGLFEICQTRGGESTTPHNSTI